MAIRRMLAIFGLCLALGTIGAGCYVGPAHPGHCPGGYWVEGTTVRAAAGTPATGAALASSR